LSLDGFCAQAVRALAAGGDLVFSGSDDTCVRVWNALSLECLRVLRGHQDNVRVLAVGNGFLYSGSWDKTVHAWNLQVRPPHPVTRLRVADPACNQTHALTIGRALSCTDVGSA
jgi:WD40 repeat protein